MPEIGQIVFRNFDWRPLGREPLFADFNLQISPGQKVALIGPSGSGKSTLLHALVGALGNSIAGEVGGVAEVGGTLGLLTQNSRPVANTLGRDVAFGLENSGLAREEIWQRVDEALHEMGLGFGRQHPADALSGGETQRLGLAGILAMRPDVLLLDEPTAMLDELTAADVRQYVKKVVSQTGVTLVVVEHKIGPWLDFVDQVIVLNEGKLDSADNVELWLPDRPKPQSVRPTFTIPSHDPRSEKFGLTEVDVFLKIRTVRGTVHTKALSGLSMSATPGEVTLLKGKSGSGKSTALETIAGLRKPAKGRVAGYLRDPSRLNPRELAKEMGWVPQNPELGFVTSKVVDEVAFTAMNLGQQIEVEQILDHFGLRHVAQSNPYRLSGGEQRRLAIAAATSHFPGLMLFDEPTAAQDPKHWARIVGWLEAAASAGKSVVAATHDEELTANKEVWL